MVTSLLHVLKHYLWFSFTAGMLLVQLNIHYFMLHLYICHINFTQLIRTNSKHQCTMVSLFVFILLVIYLACTPSINISPSKI